MRKFLIIMTLFIGIGAVVGATMMWVDPTGKMWGMEPLLEMLREKMPWPEIFFKDFIPSGYVLLALNGLPQFMAAILLIKRNRLAPYVVIACGIILMLWIVLEWCVWGFNTMSNIYFVFGLLEVIAATVSLRNTKI